VLRPRPLKRESFVQVNLGPSAVRAATEKKMFKETGVQARRYVTNSNNSVIQHAQWKQSLKTNHLQGILHNRLRHV
jgi:hypothetical protein